MPNMLFANNCNTTLSSSITNVATTLSVTSATGFPVPTGSQYFYCTLADAATQTTIEIVKVTAVSGTTFTIVRGQDGTSGTAFASGAVVSLRLVRASLNDFPKLDETNTFTADQAITGQLTTSAGLATTSTFTATPPADGLVMDYATGYGRFSAFAGDGFQWYNAGVANTKIMQLSSTGAITTATWNGATVGTGYGGTGLTSFTSGGVVYASSTSALATGSSFVFDGTTVGLGITPSSWGGGFVGLQTKGGFLTSQSSSYLYNGQNTYYNGTNWIYTTTNPVVLTEQSFGNFIWSNAPSGTSGTAVTFTERMRIFTSGGVSIGNTTDPGSGSFGVNTTAIFRSSNGSINGYTGVQVWATGASTDGIGIKNTNTSTLSAISCWNSSGTYIGGISNTSTTTALVATSDYRLKDNITPIVNATETIKKLNPVTYTWKLDNSNGQGFIAHELQDVFPQAVFGEKDAVNKDGSIKPQGIDQTQIIATLTAAFKELNVKFDAYVASHP